MKKLVTFVLIGLGTSLLLSANPAFALSLEEAKASGKVGETPSGYLEAVEGSPSADVLAVVADINAKRKAEYQKIAGKNGASITVTEQLAGKKAIENTPSGRYVKVQGKWVKK